MSPNYNPFRGHHSPQHIILFLPSTSISDQ